MKAKVNIREIALKLLDQYEAGEKYANLLLSSPLTHNLTTEQKAFLTALLYTTVERKFTYDYYICAISERSETALDPHTKNILRLGFCQLLDMNSIPNYAAVNETVKLSKSKWEKSFVNGVLRAASSNKDKLPMPDKEKNYHRYLAVKYSFPTWIVKHFDSYLGLEETERLLYFYNNAKYTDLTVNSLKTTTKDFIISLGRWGIAVDKNTYAPHSLRIGKSVNPETLPGFKQGMFFVQDRAAALVSEVLNAKAGHRVVDVCAAPGGKSFLAAITSEDAGEIICFDLHESKLSLIESGAQRLGFNSIKVAQRDALTPDESLYGTADRLICDVPCSGLGVLGKKPDLRYKSSEVMEEMPPLQLEILTASAPYLKVGGSMIYSTCTMNRAENEEVVEKFLSNHPDYALTPFTAGELNAPQGMIATIPHVHGTDGFFLAKITRVS